VHAARRERPTPGWRCAGGDNFPISRQQRGGPSVGGGEPTRLRELASSACLLAEPVAGHCLAAAVRAGSCCSPALRALRTPRGRVQAPKRGALLRYSSRPLALAGRAPGAGVAASVRGRRCARGTLHASRTPDAPPRPLVGFAFRCALPAAHAVCRHGLRGAAGTAPRRAHASCKLQPAARTLR
jgi:hypothetical protein